MFRRSDRWLNLTASEKLAYDRTFGRLCLVLRTIRPFRYVGPNNGRLASWFRGLVEAGRYDVIWIAKAVTAVALGWEILKAYDPRWR